MRVPSFRFNVAGRFAGATGQMLFASAVFWQVFHISHDELNFVWVGLVQFVPTLVLGLFAGAVADRYDRRWLSAGAQAGALVGVAAFAWLTATGEITLGWIFGLAFVVAAFSAFDQPARAALLPALVPRELFPGAIRIQSTVQQFGFVTGPVLTGFLIYAQGPELAYAVAAGLFAASIVMTALLRLLPVELPKRAVSLAAIGEGIRFVRRRQPVLGSMVLDMFAVIFGGATALLPVYAEEILDVGVLGYGILAAALDIGSFAASMVIIFLPPFRRTGRVLLLGVLFYGAFTIVFGLSRWFILSVGAYALIGIADQLSVVARQTTIQLATPDDLRGRVTSVNFLFIGASNRLGAVESGAVAALTSATFAVVSGGIGCLVVLALIAATMPELRRFRVGDAEPERAPTGLPPAEAAGEAPAAG